jgi:hypothetical protein
MLERQVHRRAGRHRTVHIIVKVGGLKSADGVAPVKSNQQILRRLLLGRRLNQDALIAECLLLLKMRVW